MANGDISATGHPIHLRLVLGYEFSGSPDRMALYPVRLNPRWRPWDWKGG